MSDSYFPTSPNAGSELEVMFLSSANISTFNMFSGPVIGWVPFALLLVGYEGSDQYPTRVAAVSSYTYNGSFAETITYK